MQDNVNTRWIVTGTSPDKYQAKIHYNIFSKRIRSANLKSISESCTNREFGTIIREIKATNLIGKEVRFSGDIRSENVSGWAALWIRICDNSGDTLRFNNMKNKAITDTSDKKHYLAIVDVPVDADIIIIGFFLCGRGQIWIDNVEFDIVKNN